MIELGEYSELVQYMFQCGGVVIVHQLYQPHALQRLLLQLEALDLH